MFEPTMKDNGDGEYKQRMRFSLSLLAETSNSKRYLAFMLYCPEGSPLT